MVWICVGLTLQFEDPVLDVADFRNNLGAPLLFGLGQAEPGLADGLFGLGQLRLDMADGTGDLYHFTLQTQKPSGSRELALVQFCNRSQFFLGDGQLGLRRSDLRVVTCDLSLEQPDAPLRKLLKLSLFKLAGAEDGTLLVERPTGIGVLANLIEKDLPEADFRQTVALGLPNDLGRPGTPNKPPSPDDSGFAPWHRPTQLACLRP